MTEATCLVSCNPVDGEKKIGSVGITFPYTQVKIYKESAEGPIEAGVDEIGEICVSNPGVWPGNTYTETDKNKDIYYQDTFLRTGDLGRFDADGYLWITGRAKDLIIRGGHNIDPELIETFFDDVKPEEIDPDRVGEFETRVQWIGSIASKRAIEPNLDFTLAA